MLYKIVPWCTILLHGIQTGAWAAATNAVGQWIQADFGSDHRVLSVSTQARSDVNFQYVRSYYISHKTDGTAWVQLPTLYQGNTDGLTTVTNELPAGLVARYVRLTVQTWHSHIALRWNVWGCEPTSELARVHDIENILVYVRMSEFIKDS